MIRTHARSRRVQLVVLAFAVAAAAVACTIPAPPPYPYWGPYGSAQGVENEAKAMSSRLEQYVKDFLDGKVPRRSPPS